VINNTIAIIMNIVRITLSRENNLFADKMNKRSIKIITRTDEVSGAIRSVSNILERKEAINLVILAEYPVACYVGSKILQVYNLISVNHEFDVIACTVRRHACEEAVGRRGNPLFNS
jgi:hypothetical protein